MGIVNITTDSFSDGGRYLQPADAIAHARRLLAAGSDIVDLGAASSHPDGEPVPADEEIRRLAPVIDALQAVGAPISVDSFLSETHRYAIRRGVELLNDIQGFADPALYPELAGASCRLVVMHSVQGRGPATRREVPVAEIWDRVLRFFEQRLATLERAGIERARVILDPGMGFFLSSKADASLRVLANLGRLKRAFDLPVLVSVSRKSFLRAASDRATADLGPATLAAELCAAAAGASYIRTHDVAALRDGLNVVAALQAEAGRA